MLSMRFLYVCMLSMRFYMLPVLFHTNILCLSNCMLWMSDDIREILPGFPTSLLGFNCVFVVAFLLTKRVINNNFKK
jgi:hypothetical protein